MKVVKQEQQVKTSHFKAFEKLAPHTQTELLLLYGNHMDALQAFDEATDRLEAFQVEKTGDFAKAFDYVTGELLEGCDLSYDVAYIVAGLDATKDTVSKNEIDLMRTIISKSTFRGKAAGIKLYEALKAFGKPVQMATELQAMQSRIASENLQIENAFTKRATEVKANPTEVSKAWELANPEHPAVVRFKEQQLAAQQANPLTPEAAPVKAKKASKK